MENINSPRSVRTHIGIFGRRNSGKSSLINALCNQEAALVSDTAGTTTDPVYKSMEILPLGPVVLIDTPGLDDVGELGAKRVRRARDIMAKCDAAIVLCTAEKGMGQAELETEKELKDKNIPYIIVFNKSDIKSREGFCVSAKTGYNIDLLREKLGKLIIKEDKKLLGGKIKKGDIAVLVTPIDESAPKGRIILPQQQVLREVLDEGAIACVAQPDELESLLHSLKAAPSIVICDSQAFAEVNKIVPGSVPLTSFSILFAQKKADFKQCLEGADALSALTKSSRVLISEGCTHRRQCGDIGSVLLPGLIKKHCGADIAAEFSSGGGFPEDLTKYDLIIHCGGCMLTDRETALRFEKAKRARVPMTNYGVAIAKMTGVLDRCSF